MMFSRTHTTLSRCLVTLVTGLVALVLAAQPASACAVCFGDPNSQLVKGAKAGVIVLAVIVYFVVFAMVGVAGFWTIRARRLAARQPQACSAAHDDPVATPNATAPSPCQGASE